MANGPARSVSFRGEIVTWAGQGAYVPRPGRMSKLTLVLARLASTGSSDY
jgi:hypothetical protein